MITYIYNIHTVEYNTHTNIHTGHFGADTVFHAYIHILTCVRVVSIPLASFFSAVALQTIT